MQCSMLHDNACVEWKCEEILEIGLGYCRDVLSGDIYGEKQLFGS